MKLAKKQKLVVILVLIVALFAILAKIDYAVNGLNDHWLPETNLIHYWVWMWLVGYPFFGLLFAYLFKAGAPNTKNNLLYSVAIFVTVILFAVGGLEDIFYYVLNGNPLPSTEEWWWMFWYMILGTWTSEMQLTLLGICIVIVASMWYYLLKHFKLRS